MQIRIVYRLMTASLLLALAAASVGCARGVETGLDSETKNAWDAPRPDNLDDALRNRLATVQRDR